MSNGNEFFKYARSLQKSGRLIHGFDPVCEELKNPKSKIAGVILASDVSEKTQKEMRFFCDKYSALLSQAIVRWTRSSRSSENARECLPFSMKAYTQALQASIKGNKRYTRFIYTILNLT